MPGVNTAAPAVIEIDALDLDAVNRQRHPDQGAPDTAYLQYTSGSTRVPAGVMMSDRNMIANFEQVMSDYFAELGGVARRTPPSCRGCPSITTWA